MQYTGPERRKAPPATRRYVAIVAVLLVVYVTGVFWYASGRTSDGDLRKASYANQLDSCIRGRAIRDEVNSRVPTHMLDARNLERLTVRLSTTRTREARAFWVLGQRLGLSRELDPLVNTYLSAAKDDAKIAQSQATVSFGTLAVASCVATVKRP